MDIFSKPGQFPRKHNRCISLESGQTFTKKSYPKTPLDLPRFYPRRYSTPELAMRKHALKYQRDDNRDEQPISNKSCQTDILGLDRYLRRSPPGDASHNSAGHSAALRTYKRPSKKPKVRSVGVHCERRRMTFAAFKGCQKFKHVYKRKISLPQPSSTATSTDDGRRDSGVLPRLRPDRMTEVVERPVAAKAVAAVKLPKIPTRDAKPDTDRTDDCGAGTKLAKLTRPQSTGSSGGGGDGKSAYFRASSAPKIDSRYYTLIAAPQSSDRERSSTTGSSDTADTALDMSFVRQQLRTENLQTAATTASATAGTRTVSTSTTSFAEPVFPIVFSCESVLRHPLDGGYVSHTESHRFSVHYVPTDGAKALTADDTDDGSRSSLVFTSAGACQNERCLTGDSISVTLGGGDGGSRPTTDGSVAVSGYEEPSASGAAAVENGRTKADCDRLVIGQRPQPDQCCSLEAGNRRAVGQTIEATMAATDALHEPTYGGREYGAVKTAGSHVLGRGDVNACGKVATVPPMPADKTIDDFGVGDGGAEDGTALGSHHARPGDMPFRLDERNYERLTQSNEIIHSGRTVSNQSPKSDGTTERHDDSAGPTGNDVAHANELDAPRVNVVGPSERSTTAADAAVVAAKDEPTRRTQTDDENRFADDYSSDRPSDNAAAMSPPHGQKPRHDDTTAKHGTGMDRRSSCVNTDRPVARQSNQHCGPTTSQHHEHNNNNYRRNVPTRLHDNMSQKRNEGDDDRNSFDCWGELQANRHPQQQIFVRPPHPRQHFDRQPHVQQHVDRHPHPHPQQHFDRNLHPPQHDDRHQYPQHHVVGASHLQQHVDRNPHPQQYIDRHPPSQHAAYSDKPSSAADRGHHVEPEDDRSDCDGWFAGSHTSSSHADTSVKTSSGHGVENYQLHGTRRQGALGNRVDETVEKRQLQHAGSTLHDRTEQEDCQAIPCHRCGDNGGASSLYGKDVKTTEAERRRGRADKADKSVGSCDYYRHHEDSTRRDVSNGKNRHPTCRRRLESVDETSESKGSNYVGGFLFGDAYYKKRPQKHNDGCSGKHEHCDDSRRVNFSSKPNFEYYHDYVPGTVHSPRDEDCTVFAEVPRKSNECKNKGHAQNDQQRFSATTTTAAAAAAQTSYYSQLDRSSCGDDKNTDSDESLTDSLEDGCKYEGAAVSYFLSLNGQKSAVTFTFKMPNTLESRLNRRHSQLKKHLHVSTTVKKTSTRVRTRHKSCQTLWTEEKGVQVQHGSTANRKHAVDDRKVLETLLAGIARHHVSENQIRVVGGQKWVSEGNQTERMPEHPIDRYTQTTRDAAAGPQTPDDSTESGQKIKGQSHSMKKFSSDNALMVGVVRHNKYKGKEALDGAKNDQLLTLSKGWINFYTLRADSADTDAQESHYNDDEVKTEDDSQQYTVHVQAIPEPVTLPVVHVPNRNSLQLTKTGSTVKHLPKLVQTENNNHHYAPHLATATSNGWCVSVDGPNNMHMKVSLLPDKPDNKTSEQFDHNEENKLESRRLALQRKTNYMRKPYRNIKRTQSTPRDMFSADVSRTESALSAESKYIETIDTQLLIQKARRRLSQEWDTRVQNGGVTESVQLVVTGDSVSSRASQHYTNRGHQHCSFRRQSRRI